MSKFKNLTKKIVLFTSMLENLVLDIKLNTEIKQKFN